MLEDHDYENKAIGLLNQHLVGITFSENSMVDKDRLLQMYMDSRDIFRQNLEDLKLSRCAEDLFYTCVRVVRCSGVLGEEASGLLIREKTYSPDAISLYKHALKLHSDLLELQE